MGLTGRVYEQLRALISVPVAPSDDGPRREIEAWIDTGFNGGLTLPRGLVTSLGLPQGPSVDAVLADGRTVSIETFDCTLDWFGKTYRTQVAASGAAYPLLGTLLLAGRRLTVDYAARTVELA